MFYWLFTFWCFSSCFCYNWAAQLWRSPHSDFLPGSRYLFLYGWFSIFFSFKFSTDTSSGLFIVCIVLSISQPYASPVSHIPLHMCSQLLKREYCQTQGDEGFQNKEYEGKGTWRSAVTDSLLYRWVPWDLMDEAMFSKIPRYLSDIKSAFPIIAYVYAKLPFLCCQ